MPSYEVIPGKELNPQSECYNKQQKGKVQFNNQSTKNQILGKCRRIRMIEKYSQ